MDTFLWVLQAILAIKLLTVTGTHGARQSKPTMQEAMQRMGGWSRPLHYAIAAIAFLGALGMLLPALSWFPGSTLPATAVVMAVFLLISAPLHQRTRETPNIFVSIILALMAGFVAYGRWMLVPL